MKKYGDSNIYLYTTIFAIIGTAIYGLIAYFLYPSWVNVYSIAIFAVVVWIAYYFIMRKKKY